MGENNPIVFFLPSARVTEQRIMPLLLESSKSLKSYKLSLIRN